MVFCSCSCCDHGHSREANRTWLTPEEKERLAARLDQRPDQSVIAYKPGKGGNQAYLPGNVVFETANSLFGFNGWSSSVLKVENDYCAEKNGRWCVGITAYVRISLKDGTFHEEVGYGCADNMPYRADAVKKCLKEAVTDAKKRALRLFGNAVGLCISDKDFVSAVKRGRGEEYQGAVETAIKKQKQLQANESGIQQSENRPVATNAVNQVSTRPGIQDVHAGRENINVQANRKDQPSSSFNPMPVGPTTNRDHNQKAVASNPVNSIQHGAMQNSAQTGYGNNAKGNFPINQRNHPPGVMHNHPNINQQGVAQSNNLQPQRTINPSGMPQNPLNCQGYGPPHTSKQQQGSALNHQHMNPMENRCSPPTAHPQGPNMFSKSPSMNQNSMSPHNRHPVSVNQNHNMPMMAAQSAATNHTNAMQGPNTAQFFGRAANHPTNAGPTPSSHHGHASVDISNAHSCPVEFGCKSLSLSCIR